MQKKGEILSFSPPPQHELPVFFNLSSLVHVDQAEKKN